MTQLTSIPQKALGLGLRPAHIATILNEWPQLDFFEIISENFMGSKGPQHLNLEKIKAHYPIVLHGVAMNLGSADPLDWNYLKDLKALADWVDAPYVTDHLCWTGVENVHLHDLLPLPQDEKTAKYVAEKIRVVQDYLERPFGIENLSSYAVVEPSPMNEWEFYNEVIDRSGCFAMLDINNVYVSAYNHQFNPKDYLDAINWQRVLQCHIAGHAQEKNGVIIDTHDHPVADPVWKLYEYAWTLSGGFKTLLEWDAKIPPFNEVLAELFKAKNHQIEPVFIDEKMEIL